MSQEDRILELLRERGTLGASNYELMNIAFQYPARIHSLRHKKGCNILAKHIAGTQWHFTLVLPEHKKQGKAMYVDLRSND